ncbi:hypothetical protein [Brachybacterium phenoliresistens]|uniref:hypothetical protein n=1 Tax=Brachybacterium phenoliresistens TaxID=396014 RepID=UPI0031D20B00
MSSSADLLSLLAVVVIGAVGGVPMGVLLAAGILAAAPGRGRFVLAAAAAVMLPTVLLVIALALGAARPMPAVQDAVMALALLGLVLCTLCSLVAAVLLLARRAGTTAATVAGAAAAVLSGAHVLEQGPAFAGLAPLGAGGVGATLGVLLGTGATVVVLLAVAAGLASLGRARPRAAGAVAVAAILTGAAVLLQVLVYALHRLVHLPLIPMAAILAVAVLGLGLGAILAAAGALPATPHREQVSPRR